MQRSKFVSLTLCWTGAFLLCFASTSSVASIEVSRDNSPIMNMGWPLGAERVANLSSRFIYWAGASSGNGQYQFLYRCSNTAQFNQSLKVFSEIRSPKLELVVHDGPEHSSYLKTSSGDETQDAARVDWTFTVWIPKSWHGLYNNPKSVFLSDSSNFRKPVPSPRIDVYIGGGAIGWDKVDLPDVANIQLIDKRADSAPLKPLGGGLVRGDVYDMATGQPIAGAEITLAKYDGLKGWDELSRATTDDLGSFSIEKIPAGRYEIRIRARNFAPRKQGMYYNKGNTYHEFIAQLMHQESIKGIVTDPDGIPISGVVVSPMYTLAIDGLGYPCADAKPATTDDEGRFEIRGLPEGFAQLNCRGPSLSQVTSSLELYEVPASFHDSSDGIRIVMTRTGIVRGRVIGSNGTAPASEVYVSIDYPGGPRVGKWGGSVTCKDDGTFEFKGVPPGEYVVSANPGLLIHGSDPDAKFISVKKDETVEVEIIKRKRER
jgi:hypothetical protein